jgi:hypothetical protein
VSASFRGASGFPNFRRLFRARRKDIIKLEYRGAEWDVSTSVRGKVDSDTIAYTRVCAWRTSRNREEKYRGSAAAAILSVGVLNAGTGKSRTSSLENRRENSK